MAFFPYNDKITTQEKVTTRETPPQLLPALGTRTEILDGVVALFIVHLDGLGVGAANAVPDGIASDHNVLVLRWRPAHDDASYEGADMKRAGHLGNTGFWEGKWKSQMRLPFP